MPWWVPIAMIGGFLLWGFAFVAVSDFLHWLKHRREKK